MDTNINKILQGTISDNGLLCINPYIKFDIGSPFITLDGRFSLEQMEEIVKFMQNNRVKHIVMRVK